MKQKHLTVIAFLIVSVSFAAFVSAQSSSRRRTPTLTTDDITTPRPSPVAPAGETGEARPVARRKIEPVRGRINWQSDLRRALDVARPDGKLVVVDVYTDWCGWCKKMDSDIYADPLIVGLSREEVFLKLDAEDGGQGEQFARQMGVRGYPTTIILGGDGQPLKIRKGYIESPQAFVNFVEEVRSAWTR